MTANGVGTCGADDNQAQAGHLIAMQCHGSNVGPMGTLRRGDGSITSGIPFVCGVLGDQSHTLTAEGFDASEDGTGRGSPVVAYAPDVAATLSRGSTAELGDEPSNALRASQGGGDKAHVLDGVIVRRLTPLECERLQGQPDGWTDVDGASDSQRYRELGNSVAVPVLTWVLGRLTAVAAVSDLEAS